MTTYQVLKSFLLLPASLCLGFFLALLATLRWRRAGMAALWGMALVFYGLSAPAIADRISVAVQTVPALTDPMAVGDAQAIVVLSAGAWGYGPEYGGVLLDHLMVARLRYTAHLYRKNHLPILVSGGPVPKLKTSLAVEMKTALEQDFGVPVTWIEDRSVDTATNATYSAEILREAGISSIILVTHASHMPRSLALFQATGLKVIPAPTEFTTHTLDLPEDLIPHMSTLERSYVALYEVFGSIWYSVKAN